MNQRVKHIILLIVAGWIALVSQMATAQTSSQNYIRTIEPGTVTNRFYLRDYLGSTAAVIDENGDVLQSTAYFPSGLPLTPNNLAPQTIKLHTGKDYFGLQDAGWYDNRARYYDCILARFTTQDPLAEKYPWLSPYNHCANNPLRYIDQNGMDIWTINDRGEITEHIVNKEIDQFIMANNDGSAKIDDEGNEVSISFKYGTIISQKSRKEIDKNRIVDIDIFKVRGDENGLNLFKFLSDNVSTPDVGIEYSLFQTGMQGENGLNFVSTSHLDAEDVSGKILFNKQLKYGYSIRRHIHSHPYGDTYSPSDARFSNSIKNILKNNNTISPSFFIYFVPAKQMIQYN
ncbi:MAG: hypothetical protein E7081_09405 [Bacteroidales bacterium]|nr:hypothetical protein [Bacteroidales bacterium]